MKVNINNSKNLIFGAKIRKIFRYTLKKLNYENSYSCNITFVDEEEIRRLNREHRNIDKVTDVLSFPLLSEDDIYNDKIIDLGDIVICKSVAHLQAKKYNHSYLREICFLSLHGFLHLLGYDHIEEEDEKVMTSLQKEILDELKVKRK